MANSTVTRRLRLSFPALYLSLAGYILLSLPAHAGVLLQGFYWDVPSPALGNPAAPWWWDHLASQANSLHQAGFTAVWLPPVLKGNSGGYSVGYDPFDDYDLGSKSQKGTLPLRYGAREQLQRTVAILRANSLDVYLDLVENHRSGDDGHYNFRYLDAYGNPGGGRFPKGPLDFHPNVPQDPDVPVGDKENFGEFGRDLAPVNGRDHHTFEGLNQAGDWLTRSLDIQGYRLDYIRGISTDWLYAFLNYGAMKGKFAVGEFYDANLQAVSGWVKSLKGRSTAFDFPLRSLLKEMCDDPGKFDMGRLDHAGLAGIDPQHAVTFVENHDTDRSDPAVHGKALAYAYILTSEGYPCVFYRDYSADPGCYHLKSVLDPLIWIHETLARGPNKVCWKEKNVLAYERLGVGGSPHLLVALNDDRESPHTITVSTGFGRHILLHDYTGHGSDLRTDDSGRTTLTIPADSDGGGYVCYSTSQTQSSESAIPNRRSAIRNHPSAIPSVSQEFAGAQDLDIKPADNTMLAQVCRVWPAPGKPLRSSLSFDTRSWTARTHIYLELDGPGGARLASHSYFQGAQGQTIAYIPPATGWYTFKIRSYDTPADNLKPSYRLKLTYTGPQTLSPEGR